MREGAMIGGWPSLLEDGRLLVVRFPRVHRTLSWAVCGGGLGLTRAVVWRYTEVGELSPSVDAAALLEASLKQHGLERAVGMMTARALGTFDCVTKQQEGVAARAVATVGLGNALAVGDSPGPLRDTARVGTINILVQLSHALDEAALAEALGVATEARTCAVLDGRVPSRRAADGSLASGTGTDCIVVAAPEIGEPLRWVGKHTVAGALVGGAVREAVTRGVRRWIAEEVARGVQGRSKARG
ncbi:MAG: adenosylcobinamide amidohydrolase [Myxococcales bacterium]|nr:adenosylcobinamide amidohydrolase [Myxococcales bacterium]